MSDLKPTTARNGANTSGSETITATSQAGTPSSTIMTRLSVPISSTTAMPTVTWNSDRRSRRPHRQLRRGGVGEGQEGGAEVPPVTREVHRQTTSRACEM